MLAAILEGGSATIDDVRALVDLPPGIGPKLFGAAPGPLVRAGIIRAAGFAKTCRPAAHARPVTVWELIDGAAAERWLHAHPDPDFDRADELCADRQGLLFGASRDELTPTVAAAGAKGW